MRTLLRLFTLLVGLLALARAAQAAQPHDRLLVLPPQVGEGVPSAFVSSVEALVVEQLHESGRFQVLGRSDLAALVGLERQREVAGCTDSDCAAQIAGALDVRLVGALSIDRLGETSLLSIRIVDTSKTRVLGRASRTLRTGQDVAQAVGLLVGALITEYEQTRAEDAPHPVAGATPTPTPDLPARPTPARSSDAAIDALDPPLMADGPLARTAGPDALAAFSTALAAERQGLLLPDAALSAWAAVAGVSSQNPFRDAASARALAWQGFLRRRSEDQRLALSVARNEKVDAGYKRAVLDRLGRTYGEETFVPVLDELVPATLRRELCLPRVQQRAGAVALTVRALDDAGVPVRGEVQVDGVPLGETGRTYRVPACASAVRIVATRRSLIWSRPLALAGRRELEVVARFPGARFEATSSVVRDFDGRLTWQRAVPHEPSARRWASEYCRSLREDGGGWRVPTADELASLHVPATAAEPDDVTFPDAPEGWYWASGDDAATVLFDVDATRGGVSPRFGAAPSVDGRGFVRCVRSVPRFAVRLGLGTLTGIVGVGAEARVGPLGFCVGTGTHLLTGGLSLSRASDTGGFYLDVHVALVRTGLLGRELAPGIGGGVAGGYDFRPLHFLSVKAGLALAWSSANLHSTVPAMFELNAGPVF